ncbi:hypothetical protein [Roseinatronobacter sp. S2]|uniref:hypothetical protein n=1 Tax=Roseinatronobacter sp. S2 TaxID=3035471 RepID=UPI0024107292|nr:hypothetical protein [Roseinatronobacter sp. S2]WFE73367.1 hypothetical protein P8S53_09215 [Roseinatronobacter sp. S2]
MSFWSRHNRGNIEIADGACNKTRRDPLRSILIGSLIAMLGMLLANVFVGSGPVHNIDFNVNATHNHEELILNGATNLSDGAIIEYQIPQASGDDLVGRMTVENGLFHASFSLDQGEDALEIEREAVLVFQMIMSDRLQHVEIVRRYGGFGEHLGGAYVVNDDLGQHLRVQIPLE